jgi:hypothetical protein
MSNDHRSTVLEREISSYTTRMLHQGIFTPQFLAELAYDLPQDVLEQESIEKKLYDIRNSVAKLASSLSRPGGAECRLFCFDCRCQESEMFNGID